MDCAFDDDRTIVVAKVDFAISANVVLYILKSLLSPFRMTIYHMLSVRQVVWRVIYTRPNLPQAEWLVMRRLLGWVIDSNDGYVHISNWGMHSDFKLLIFMSGDLIDSLDHSCYTPGRIAQSVVYRLHDPKIVGSILDSTKKYFSLRKCQKQYSHIWCL